jgi:hypothetical protein
LLAAFSSAKIRPIPAWCVYATLPSYQKPSLRTGFGKFETLGTTTVSLLLVGGALGIGFHSYYLLLDALYPAIQSLPPGAVQDVLQSAAEATEAVASHAAHGHAHAHSLDPNAAWFAAIGVVAKEWLYRITKKVADDERSSVLRANAIHHRSDAWSSLVALVAILGSWAIPGLPLDPIGGACRVFGAVCVKPDEATRRPGRLVCHSCARPWPPPGCIPTTDRRRCL